MNKYLHKILCFLGYHEVRGQWQWELLEKPFWDQCLPVGYDQTKKMMNSLDKYLYECIYCKQRLAREGEK